MPLASTLPENPSPPTNGQRTPRTGRNLAGATVLAALVGVTPSQGNPPPPAPFALPDVQPIRVTAGRQISPLMVNQPDPRGKPCFTPGDPCYEMMFEVQNWTDQDVYGVLLVFNEADFEDLGENPPPIFFAGFGSNRVDADGRPFGIGSNDDANFPGGSNPDGTGDPAKTGAANNFEMDFQAETTSRVLFTLDSKSFSGIPPRDLLGAANSTAACNLVPGCNPVDLTIDPERVDNGLAPDNVLDGFVVAFEDFFFDEVASINFFLLDIAGNPIGYDDGTQIVGNGFGFGVINVFQVDGYAADRSHGPPVWTRESRGSLRGVETGNTGTEDPPNNLRDMFPGPTPQTPDDDPNLVFQVEIGSALTGRFLDPTDAPPETDSNGDTLPQFPVELMSFSIEG